MFVAVSHQASGLPGGLDVARTKYPLSLPSPGASDPAPLDPSQANIVPANHYKLPNESLQHRNLAGPGTPVFIYVRTLAVCVARLGEHDKAQRPCIFKVVNYAPRPGIAGQHEKRNETTEIVNPHAKGPDETNVA